MIDTIYQIVKVIINKELRGNLTPDEFNKLAKQVQDEIFAEYFGDNNLQQNRFNRGLVNKNHANLTSQIRQKIDHFHEFAPLIYNGTTSRFDLPSDLYYIEDNGLYYNTTVIEELTTADRGYFLNSNASPSTVFPMFTRFSTSVQVLPSGIVDNVNCSYLRVPKDPKWTYTSVGNVELFDNTLADFQDFELHVSELPNIVIMLCSYFGVNIREADVMQYAEMLKQKEEVKEQQQ